MRTLSSANAGYIENTRVINEKIDRIRDRARKGLSSPNAAAKWLEAVRLCHELKTFIEDYDPNDVVHPLAPKPFGQVVGYGSSEKFAAEWRLPSYFATRCNEEA